MSPEQISAACAASAIVGAVFLWVVKMVVEKAIRDAINGFKTKQELSEAAMARVTADMKELEQYTHKAMHDRFDKLASTLLETFRAGREVGRSGG